MTYKDEQSSSKQIQLYYRKNNGYWKAGDITTTTTHPLIFDSTSSGDGYYSFYTVATDLAGNIETATMQPGATTLIMKEFHGKHVFVNINANNTWGLGDQWKNAIPRIEDALIIAGAFNIPDIWVATGTYHESINMRSDVAIYGGFSGKEKALEERRIKKHPTIINALKAYRADGTEADHVVVFNETKNSHLNGFTITGGHFIYGRRTGNSNGAGILCLSADESNVIDQCTIVDNHSTIGGGGIHCDRSSPRIQHCVITGNSGKYGGGVFNYDGALHLSNCIVSENEAMEGGGVFLQGITHYNKHDSKLPSPSIINYCTIIGNKLKMVNNDSLVSGGIYHTSFSLGKDNKDAQLVITNCILMNNDNNAISVESYYYMFPIIRYCLFHNNTLADFSFHMSPSAPTLLRGGEQINLQVPQASGNLSGDPEFISIARKDYHLLPNSPAIDSGAYTGSVISENITGDLEGIARPQDGDGKGAGQTGDGSDFDIGAHEYHLK